MRRIGNAAHLELLWHSEDVDEDREVLAELWAGWCEARRSGERVRKAAARPPLQAGQRAAWSG